MTKDDTDFETWVSCIQMQVLDATEIDLDDDDTEYLRTDYDNGRDMNDVIDELIDQFLSDEIDGYDD